MNNNLTRFILYGYKQEEHFDIVSLSSDRMIDSVQSRCPSQKVEFFVKGKFIQIAVGQSHGLLLTNDNELYTVGSNQFGQRGNFEPKSYEPTQLHSIKSVMAISAGLYHSVCLNSLGQSFIWGRTYTDCDEIQCYNEPTLVDIREKLSHVSCGGSHTVFLTSSGVVYSMGDNQQGQLGQTSNNKTNLGIVKFPNENTKIKQIQCGLEHTLFLSTNNELFACGNNLFSQCGIDNVQTASTPQRVNLKLPDNEFLTQIKASTGTFSACLTSKNNLYVWGTGSWGHARKPTLVTQLCTFPPQTQIRNVHVGDNYAIVESEERQFFLFGQRDIPESFEQKFECAKLDCKSGIMVAVGFKMMMVVLDETQALKLGVAKPKQNDEQKEDNVVYMKQQKLNFKFMNVYLLNELEMARQEIRILRKELEQCKLTIQKKDQLLQQQEINSKKLNDQSIISSTNRHFIQLSDNKKTPAMNEVKLFQDYTTPQASHYQSILRTSNCFLSSATTTNKDYKLKDQLRQNETEEKKQFKIQIKPDYETRFKKVDEDQFSLSLYQLKSIRSVHAHESSRQQSPFEQIEIKRSSQVHENVLPQPKNNRIESLSFSGKFQSENVAQKIQTADRTRVPYKQTSTLDNSIDHSHSINTSIIDKICSYQKSMISKFSTANKITEQRPPTIFQPRYSVGFIPEVSLKQNNLSYQSRPLSMDKQQEDYFKLRA